MAGKRTGRPNGRPVVWTPEARERVIPEICRRLAEGETLVAICKSEGMPPRGQFLSWVLDDSPAGLSNTYARAREVQAEGWVEELPVIADAARNANEAVAQRLKFDARRWAASKILPKKYGEKVDVTSGGAPLPGSVDLTKLSTETLRRVREELAAADDAGPRKRS